MKKSNTYKLRKTKKMMKKMIYKAFCKMMCKLSFGYYCLNLCSENCCKNEK
tara:strand:- start:6620 stop:6772 length:153 start_codon:yes stop_codon:yes gene_type:complete